MGKIKDSSASQNLKPAKDISPIDSDLISNPEIKKGPLSFLSGAMTSILLAWICFEFSKKVVIYFTMHSPHYSSAFAQSIASGFKTLIIGISFLATFTFSFIGIGLIVVFFRSLIDAKVESNS
tara:strand:+ start:144 stop:512 length:369 start_codon:yes stop_codon:yes gene_type:complete